MIARKRALVAFILLGALLLTGCGGAANAGHGDGRSTVRVAAASDLKFALDDIAAELAAAEPEIELAITYGSSGTFFQQISNGAPFDLYLSADLAYPRELAGAGLAYSDDLFAYAVGRLVLWTPDGSPVDPDSGLAALADPEVTRVAIANPEHAPYGVAAVAAMQSAGVYEAVEDKLVLGENVAQAAEFVQSGNAQAGIIALSLALSPPLLAAGSYAEIPLDTFLRIDQGGVVLAGARDAAAAHRVKDYLTSEPGQAVLERYGFFLPDS
ncbi:MAG TPA: molybdate ABC transporter substrate-binding protein [Jiangellaceae bacterium]|nr:molybdate ABC transporter substrate-binding protein [Jiangellaceae bacterium]